MRSGISLSIGVAVLALSILTVPALAHHGWGGNQSEEFEITGTLHRAVSLAGPHATLQLMVDGQVWDATLAPPARTSRSGLTEDIIPVGAEITLHGHRSRDMNRFEVKTERVMWDGQTFAVYPNRN